MPSDTFSREIRTVAAVSTGTIGASWVAYFLAQGLEVEAFDPAPQAEARLHEAVTRHWSILERSGLADGASLARLRFHAELTPALARADFVQESGPERLDFKTDLFRRLDAATAPDVLLASSSSGLAVSAFQSACAHPQRVVLGHPFNPPHLIPLVEVGGGAQTSPEAIAQAMAFYARIGKRPVQVRREVPGHIANRLQAALWREAFHLVESGVASVEDIDTAIAHGPGLRWALLGPFMNLHLGGGEGGIAHMLAHLGGPIEAWWRDLGEPSLTPALVHQVVDGLQAVNDTRDVDAVVEARDALLLALLQAKAARPSLG